MRNPVELMVAFPSFGSEARWKMTLSSSVSVYSSWNVLSRLSSLTCSGVVGKLSCGGVLMEKFPILITMNCVGRSRKSVSPKPLPLPPSMTCLLRLVRLSGRLIDSMRTVEHIWKEEEQEFGTIEHFHHVITILYTRNKPPSWCTTCTVCY